MSTVFSEFFLSVVTGAVKQLMLKVPVVQRMGRGLCGIRF